MRRVVRDTEASSRRVTRRALVLGGAMSAMIAGLGARMRYLGVEQADEFRLLAEENRINIRLIKQFNRSEYGESEDRLGDLTVSNSANKVLQRLKVAGWSCGV